MSSIKRSAPAKKPSSEARARWLAKSNTAPAPTAPASAKPKNRPILRVMTDLAPKQPAPVALSRMNPQEAALACSGPMSALFVPTSGISMSPFSAIGATTPPQGGKGKGKATGNELIPRDETKNHLISHANACKVYNHAVRYWTERETTGLGKLCNWYVSGQINTPDFESRCRDPKMKGPGSAMKVDDISHFLVHSWILRLEPSTILEATDVPTDQSAADISEGRDTVARLAFGLIVFRYRKGDNFVYTLINEPGDAYVQSWFPKALIALATAAKNETVKAIARQMEASWQGNAGTPVGVDISSLGGGVYGR